MRDDFLTRDWAEQHKSMSTTIVRLIQTISVSLARLHAKQFEAPWKSAARERCG